MADNSTQECAQRNWWTIIHCAWINLQWINNYAHTFPSQHTCHLTHSHGFQGHWLKSGKVPNRDLVLPIAQDSIFVRRHTTFEMLLLTTLDQDCIQSWPCTKITNDTRPKWMDMKRQVKLCVHITCHNQTCNLIIQYLQSQLKIPKTCTNRTNPGWHPEIAHSKSKLGT